MALGPFIQGFSYGYHCSGRPMITGAGGPALPLAAPDPAQLTLSVAPGGRFLRDGNGNPFLPWGEAAWNLSTQLAEFLLKQGAISGGWIERTVILVAMPQDFPDHLLRLAHFFKQQSQSLGFSRCELIEVGHFRFPFLCARSAALSRVRDRRRK